MKLSKEQTYSLKRIKLVVTDVDGVLTDGGLFYTSEGLIMKKFNVKDGMGMKLLRDAGIKNAIITTDTSDLIKVRSERLKVDHLYLGTWDKDKKMMEICELENILPEEVAFIGDDVNDIDIIHKSGFSASPNDALSDIKNIVDLVLSKNGGEGAFREFADLILKAKK